MPRHKIHRLHQRNCSPLPLLEALGDFRRRRPSTIDVTEDDSDNGWIRLLEAALRSREAYLKEQAESLNMVKVRRLLYECFFQNDISLSVHFVGGVGDDDNWASVVDNGADERLLKGGGGGESDASVGKSKGKSLKQASYFSDESREDD